MVVGAKKNVMSKKLFQEAAETTDESFALLVFENNYDVWKYDFEQREAAGDFTGAKAIPLLAGKSVVYGDSPEKRAAAKLAAGPRKEKCVKDGDKPKYKYTKDEGGEGKRYQGWTDAGIERFNELDQLVTSDRQENKFWDERFLDFQKKCLEATFAGKQKQPDASQQPKKYIVPRTNIRQALAKMHRV